MNHQEDIRLVPGGKTAVMFIHGIAGTPNHFRDVIPLVDLVPEAWSVYNVLLPGHGGTVGDFSHSSPKEWKLYVWEVFEKLAETHDQVILASHSMGTLFSIQLALKYPDKIPLLFLLAVPLRPYVGFQTVNNSLRLVFGKLRESKPLEFAIGTACGCKPTRKIWKYLGWIPGFTGLLLEIRRTSRMMENLSVPVIAFQSGRDELVRASSAKTLMRKGVEDVRVLPDSGHYYYAPEDKKAVLNAFLSQIKRRLD